MSFSNSEAQNYPETIEISLALENKYFSWLIVIGLYGYRPFQLLKVILAFSWLWKAAFKLIFSNSKNFSCCNLSAGVAQNARFTTNGMCAKNNTHINVERTSNNRVIAASDLYCCLLPQCEALRTCRSGFPIATKWCCDQVPLWSPHFCGTWTLQETTFTFYFLRSVSWVIGKSFLVPSTFV